MSGRGSFAWKIVVSQKVVLLNWYEGSQPLASHSVLSLVAVV